MAVLVVREMVSVAQLSSSNELNKKNKIPEYAKDYKNEYLFIRGINKACAHLDEKHLTDVLYHELFITKQCESLKLYMKKFLKAQELGYLKDISSFVIKKDDIESTGILFIKVSLNHLAYDVEKGCYNYVKGYSDFYELFCKYYEKLNIEGEDDSDSDSDFELQDSDSDSESGFM